MAYAFNDDKSIAEVYSKADILTVSGSETVSGGGTKTIAIPLPTGVDKEKVQLISAKQSRTSNTAWTFHEPMPEASAPAKYYIYPHAYISNTLDELRVVVCNIGVSNATVYYNVAYMILD